MAAKLEIRGDGIFSKVYLDGQEINGVHSLTLDTKAGKVPQVTLKIHAVDVGITLDSVCAQTYKTRWATLKHLIRCIRDKRTFAFK